MLPIGVGGRPGIRASATAPLIMLAITETSRPMPADSMSLGLSRRSTALMMMTTAAIAMQVPSMIAEKCLALLVTEVVVRVGGTGSYFERHGMRPPRRRD